MGSWLHRPTLRAGVAFALALWANTGCGVRSFVVGDAATDTDGSSSGSTSDDASAGSQSSTTDDDTMESDSGTSSTTSTTDDSTTGAAQTGGTDSGDVNCDTLPQSDCEQSSECDWFLEQAVCIDHELVEMCEIPQNQTDCLATAMCEWDIAESQCEYDPG